ncbi:hypothetical protein [Glutamicibacter sp. PS]|uniref:hypothetical protein n=1 Tax=Glutamicibacter TaxID=1742989 RepID=UPI00283E24CF|nr:hypothetical protein [Glutamicibacter sp. PS]MDR4533909.1 hypothetical protein [Glutamicibacter sp. PS]
MSSKPNEDAGEHVQPPNYQPSSDLKKRIDAGEADPITTEQQAMAARLRVKADQRMGRQTPQWIIDLSHKA